MTQVSFVRTPGGEELAILPRAEFEQLTAAADHVRALADYRSGQDPGLNAAETRELLAATSPLAFWRRKRGFTQARLAEAAGLTQNYVSDLELKRREGSPAQWLRIARAIGIRLEELIED